MDVSITGMITNNTDGFDSSLSSLDTTIGSSTSVWSFAPISYDEVSALYQATGIIQHVLGPAESLSAWELSIEI